MIIIGLGIGLLIVWAVDRFISQPIGKRAGQALIDYVNKPSK